MKLLRTLLLISAILCFGIPHTKTTTDIKEITKLQSAKSKLSLFWTQYIQNPIVLHCNCLLSQKTKNIFTISTILSLYYAAHILAFPNLYKKSYNVVPSMQTSIFGGLATGTLTICLFIGVNMYAAARNIKLDRCTQNSLLSLNLHYI